MLLVSALLIFTPANFFAVSPPTIDLDKDSKEKKKKLRSTLALLWMVSIQPPYKRQHAFSVTRRSKIYIFTKCRDNG